MNTKQRLLTLIEQALNRDNSLDIRVPIAIKLAISIAILIVSGMSALGFVILENQKSVLSQQINDMGSAITKQFANSATEMVLSDDNLGLQTLVNNLVDNQQIKGAIIISEKGDTLVSNGITPSLEIIQNEIHQTEDSPSIKWSSTHDLKNALVYFNHPIKFNELLAGHVLITFSKHHMIQLLEKSRFVIVMITAVMTLFAIFLAFVMSRHLSKPIHSLVDASKAIGEGNFQYRLNERRNDEIGELACAFNHMAHGLLQKAQVEDVFSRYVSSNVAKEILDNLNEVEVGGKHVEASVLFADIVGFTSISERLPPEQVTEILNEYFTYISSIAEYYNGHVDKFMGDCAMVVFGVPKESVDHSFNSIACAVMIREAVERLNEQREIDNKVAFHFKIGVNTGLMIAGNLGSSDRMEYTVIGDPVNIASRLASIAQGDQIIVLEELYKQADIETRVIANRHKIIRVRGKQDEVSTYLVENLKPDFRIDMDRQITKILDQPIDIEL